MIWVNDNITYQYQDYDSKVKILWIAELELPAPIEETRKGISFSCSVGYYYDQAMDRNLNVAWA